uniref:Secreted protein n=1 Tax=Achlya hypogyna TaxID=1202772 RepID=A0A0A7CMR9_ACHHY|nr:secreted protein [Achlya hypogyna]
MAQWTLIVLAAWLAVQIVAESNDEVFALDGDGRPVAWWFVLKLPAQVRSATGTFMPTPCDCAPPACASPEEPLRAHGLCYLYADANNPVLRHFRDVGYDCLGQGGRDPVSQTLRQKQTATHWGYFNDQLNGLAFMQQKSLVCGGSSSFNAHSKGMVAFEAATGGFVLQTSTPNFPDPSSPAFVPLGCQADNNVEYAQHLFAMSLDAAELLTLATGWQSARLCSANHYHTLHDLLVSPSLANASSSLPPVAQAVARALVEERLTPSASSQKTVVTKGSPVAVSGLFKSHRAQVPPWAMAASAYASDVSVASWWDENFGTPTLCDGDAFGAAAESFCLRSLEGEGVHLRPDGTFPFNVENLMEASWKLPTGDVVSWSLQGGRVRDGNHGGLTLGI